ncbi:uncharacterized protein LOC110834656 [Zootermopsis nevadensis]|uniref:Uncharacterized protein n=1 Tax=Zootermopsis nevadensis TaxID=136037 RepID=A0A067QY21_ZOONE|nr:uncharacterized protein LOC110834656 [Zootermopsis nevadensis]KDR14284.1 hypothetical protein L798_11733 [Zootermopsis nevadensis]
MVTILLVSALCAQATLGATVYPTGVPMYSDSFIPAAAQVVYHVIEYAKDLNNSDPRTGKSVHQSLKIPLEISDNNNTDEVRGTKPLTRTQKQLLNLHNALIREAKLQGLAKYQGFSEDVLSFLRETSKTTSGEQLRMVLQEALSRGHIQRGDTKDVTEKVIADLDDSDSELCKTMTNLKPLQYV